jgi:hypothetical protein
VADFTDTEYAWAAGFLDGEGCFRLIRRQGKGKISHVSRQSYIGASQTVREPLDKLAEMFGGKVRIQKRLTVSGKTAWHWEVNGAETVRNCIIKLLPYLMVKQNQAKVVLAFTYEMGLRGCIYTSEQIMKREEIIAAWEAVA